MDVLYAGTKEGGTESGEGQEACREYIRYVTDKGREGRRKQKEAEIWSMRTLRNDFEAIIRESDSRIGE